jgi:nucleoside-diphosphate-sugar epimerase
MKFENPEKEVLQPAISAVTSLLTRAATYPQISRVVITSSAGALRDLSTTQYAPGSVYNSSSWNPATYASAVTSTQGLYIYAASKALSERAAWDFVDAEKPRFTISTVIMPLVIGPPANGIESMDEASESAKILWGIAQGQYPNEDSRRVSPWCVDVYEVAEAHVQALLKPEAGGKRWLLSGPRWSLGLVKEFLDEECSWAETGELMGDDVRCEFAYEGEEAAKKLGLEYRTLEESLRAAFEGWKKIDDAAKEREMTGSSTDGM